MVLLKYWKFDDFLGVEGFIMRRRRRSVSDEYQYSTDSYYTNSNSYLDWKLGSLPESQRTELLQLWGSLEKVLGRQLDFDEDVCVRAVHKYSSRPYAVWSVLNKYSNDASNNFIERRIKKERYFSKW